jgi:hypothetical protein
MLLIETVHISTKKKPGFSATHKVSGGPFLHQAPYQGSSPQNSVLLHDLCPAVQDPHLPYMDANTTILFHLVLMIRTQNVCCASQVTDLLADVSNLAPHSSFSSVSTPTCSLSSEHMTFLVGTVFHTFLIQRSHTLTHKQCGNDLVRALGA